MTQAKLLNSTLRNQVYLEQFKSGEVNQFAAFLKRIDQALREQLSRDDITSYSRTRFERLLRSVEGSLAAIFSDYYDELAGHLIDLALFESEFESNSLNNALAGVAETSIPSPDQVRVAVFGNPLSVRGPNGGKLMEPFIKDWIQSDTKLLSGQIRQGFFEGATNFEILRRLRGTKANRFTDGALNTVNNHGKAIVRTAIQHAASSARFETWKRNEDLIAGYRWVSTLDSRTSTICRSLDGQIFKIGKGPRPPVHIACRSTTIAELAGKYKNLSRGRTRASKNGPVDANLSYYDWLKLQSPDFQDDVLGPTRGKLLRKGGLTANQFQSLQLGRNFKPLTLEQMREREPRAFDLANVEDASEAAAKEYVVSNGRRLGGEFAFASVPDAGEFLFKKRGESSSVSFTGGEISQLKANPQTILYHNHPSGSSLSRADLEFTQNTGIREIVAFSTKTEGEYRARILPGATDLRRSYNLAEEAVRDAIWPAVRSRTISVDEANSVHAHLVNVALHKKSVIDYRAPELSPLTKSALNNGAEFFEAILDGYNPS